MLWYVLEQPLSLDRMNRLSGYLFHQGLEVYPHERCVSFVGKGIQIQVFPSKVGFVFTGESVTSQNGSVLLREMYQQIPGFERLDEDQPGEIERMCARFPYLHELR